MFRIKEHLAKSVKNFVNKGGGYVVKREIPKAEAILEEAVIYAAMDAGKVEAAKTGTSKRQWVEDTLVKKQVEVIDGAYKS